MKKRAFPKVSDPCETSLKKSKKHRAAATRHFVREGRKSEKKLAILDERGANLKKAMRRK